MGSSISCCFNLKCSSNTWRGDSFHMLICHLYIFFGEVSATHSIHYSKCTFPKVWSYRHLRAPLGAQLVKNLPTMWETWVRPLGREDPLKEGTANHSSILAWRIPWTIQSMVSQRVGHDWATFTSRVGSPGQLARDKEAWAPSNTNIRTLLGFP